MTDDTSDTLLPVMKSIRQAPRIQVARSIIARSKPVAATHAGDEMMTNDIKHWAAVSRFILVRLCNYLHPAVRYQVALHCVHSNYIGEATDFWVNRFLLK